MIDCFEFIVQMEGKTYIKITKFDHILIPFPCKILKRGTKKWYYS